MGLGVGGKFNREGTYVWSWLIHIFHLLVEEANTVLQNYSPIKNKLKRILGFRKNGGH